MYHQFLIRYYVLKYICHVFWSMFRQFIFVILYKNKCTHHLHLLATLENNLSKQK